MSHLLVYLFNYLFTYMQ